MRHRHPNPAVLLPVLFLAAAGPRAASAQVAFESLFTVVDTLVLEERDDALNALPSLRRDPAGGWLVSDRQENQVRVYDENGGLVQWFGRGGKGPGEFDDLAGVVRLPSGDLVTVDFYGSIGVWSPEGVFRRQFRVDVVSVTGATLVPPDTLVLVTTPRVTDPTGTGPVLHVVHIGSDSLLASVLEPHIAPGAVAAWVTVMGASLTPAGEGRHLLALPLADTVFEISSFLPPSMVRLPVHHELFEPLQEIPNGHADRAGFMEWIRRASFLGGTYPAGRDAIIAAVWGADRDPRLFLVWRSSGRSVEIEGGPTLSAYDPSTGLHIFRDPGTLEPNRFLLARLNAGAVRLP